MTTIVNRLYAPLIPGSRRQRPRHRVKKINYWSLLAARMAQSPLLKVYESGKPVWSVDGHIVNPLLVQQAITSGHLIVRDPGLFDDGDALAYQLNPIPGDHPPPDLPPTHNVETWVNRALRLQCVVCGNAVYTSRTAARADIEKILRNTSVIDDLKTALTDTLHGGRLCHVHM